MSLRNVNAYTFDWGEILSIGCPENSILSIPNVTDYNASGRHAEDVKVKKIIDFKEPLIITVQVSNTDIGVIYYNGSDENACRTVTTTDTWDGLTLEIFKRAIFPRMFKHRCPVRPQSYPITRYPDFIRANLEEDVPIGTYEFSYTAKSNTVEDVLSNLRLRFNCRQ